ncbi:Gamma-aminobutyric acid type B receptor subunit 1 [Stylophora pistillata]|uniref:Gamma-aminobutyric acid type B receptor subunit 1 n=1 Tax=Stylophora pistillata TaxID=50429 RepID=A0A2B4RYI8_STYPI|nr:Gamma-aminobutyric acid type B receptor subunit 1 [Stylophora pistillata]
MIDTEVWVPFDREYHVGNEVLMDAGSIGFTGRSLSSRLGWFTNSFFVGRMWSEHHQPADHWRALQLRVILQELSLASELITCQACIEHEFHPLQCVQLNQSGKNCVTLLAAQKGNLSSFMIEDQIKSLQLNVSVLWLGNNLTSTVLLNEAKGKPLLFCAWDPSPLTTASKFRRIIFPECSFPSNYIALNLTNKSHGGCDFPLYDLRKFVWKEIQMRYKDIYGLLKAISLTREQITDILQQVGTTQNSTSINDSVCHWMNKSRDIWLPWIQAETTAKRIVYIGGMFPSLVEAKAVWSSPGDEVGAQLAIKEINREIRVLERCKLELLVAPTQCRRELVISAYIRYLNLDHAQKVIGIVGPACSKATLPIAEVARFHNTILMGYGADDVSLSDRTRFPMFFRTNPSVDEFKLAFLSIFRAFSWKKCAILREAKYPVNTVQSRTEFLTKNGVQVLSRELPSDEDLDAQSYVKNVAESKLTVIMLDAYPAVTRAVTCQAYKEGLTPEKGYVWFLLDWLESDWWDVDFFNSKKHAAPESVPCSTDDLKTFVDQGYFTLSSPFFGDDEQPVVGGGTVKQWKERYRSTVAKQKKEWSGYASFAHDAVWTYALALDQLLKNDSLALDKIDTNSTSV